MIVCLFNLQIESKRRITQILMISIHATTRANPFLQPYDWLQNSKTRFYYSFKALS